MSIPLDREAAIALNRAAIALDDALRGLWDARDRGDVGAFDFYRQAVVSWCGAVQSYAVQVQPKPPKEVTDER